MGTHNIWRKAFIKSLSNCGIVRQACKESNVDPTTVHRKRKTDPVFAADWQQALDSAADELESEIRRRAFAGSDLLAIFLMKGLRPEKFREKVYISTEQLDKLIEQELRTLKGEDDEVDPIPSPALN